MTDLLINEPTPSDTRTGTLFGGLPTVPRGTPFTWPVCRGCAGPMQYLGRISIPADAERPPRFALLFMCNNRPGLCDEWDADEGGNAVLLVPAIHAEPVDAAPAPTAVRRTVYGATISTVSQPNYDLARDEWAKTNSKSARQVIGSFRGEPTWVQSEFTPTCDTCGAPMQFIAQLEEGPDPDDDMNFGGDGCAYVYECRCDSNAGKMHWQCG